MRNLYVFFHRFSPKLKIVISCYQVHSAHHHFVPHSLTSFVPPDAQIIAAFNLTLSIRFPDSFAALLHILSVVNLALSFGSPKCEMERFDYVDRMMVITLLPAFILVLTCAACAAHMAYIRAGLSVLVARTEAHRVVRHYTGFLITVIYLILPSVRFRPPSDFLLLLVVTFSPHFCPFHSIPSARS